MRQPPEATSDELRLLLKKATGRPWQVTDALHFGLSFSVIDARGNCIAPCRELGKDTDKHNAAIIVAAVNSLPVLLDAVDERDRLRAENTRLREALEPFARESPHIRSTDWDRAAAAYGGEPDVE